MGFKFTFKHGLYEYAGCAKDYHKELASADELRRRKLLENICASKGVFMGYLDAIVSNGIEVSDWFTIDDARQLSQEADFDWTDTPKFVDWFESFFQQYRMAIRTGKQEPKKTKI